MKKALLNILFALTLLTWSYEAMSQAVISGRVTDQDGEPLIGATILEQGTTNGTTADISGNYSISVQSGAVLEFKYLGFVTKTIAVDNQTQININLSEDTEVLDEVVVTALGFKVDKDNVGYANSNVSGETITRSSESTLINSLSGKSSGVRINRQSGDPGAGANIQIRGAVTLGSNQPLIVVDGVPISNDVRGNSQRGYISQQSRLNDINPNDIESMTVLKGAAAAALWGTQAANGAIVITTKQGKFNQKLKVSLKSTYSMDVINRKYPLQDKFGQGNGGVYNPSQRDSWGDKISDRTGGADEFDTSGGFFVDQNGEIYYPIVTKNSRETFLDSNFDDVFQTGRFWENSMTLSGGNQNGNFFFSLSDLDQEGIIRTSDYKRTTVRFNGEQFLNDKVKLNVNSSYTKTSSNRVKGGASNGGLYIGLLRTAPDFDNSAYRGDYYESSDAAPIANRHRSYRNPVGEDESAGYTNPLWAINESEHLTGVDRFINTFKLTYNPVEWLDLIGRVGLDTYLETRSEFYTPGSVPGSTEPAFNLGGFAQGNAKNSILNMDYIAKANYSINADFKGSFLVGFNYNKKRREVNESAIVDFIQFVDRNSTTRDMDNAFPENREVQSTVGEEITAGVYSELNLSAYDMLYLNATLRAESASTFGSESDPTFYFPSVSLAWKFSELVDFTPMTFGKLRFSYGEVGVQPGRYNTNNEIVQPSYRDGAGGSLDIGLFGGYTFSSTLGNPFLRPERKKEIEIGSDLRFFEDRLSVSGTYFTNKTEDVLFEVDLANTTGYSSVTANAATIENNGIELDLNYLILNSNNFSWSAGIIYTRIRNEVTSLEGTESFDLGGLGATSSRAVEGYPLGVLWGSRTLRDEAGNIIFDENGFPEQDDEEGIIGDPNPDWQGSFISNFRYKNFGLSVLFETYQGADIMAGTKSVLYDMGTWGASAIETTTNQNLLDYNGDVIPAGTTFRGVVKDFGAGPVALTENWYTADGAFFGSGNDELYIEDGSWTRLREITLSYHFENDWLKSKGLGSIDVSATGRNLFLWTEFEGNDPDTNLSGVSNARGIDYFNNPSTKSYIFSLLLNF